MSAARTILKRKYTYKKLKSLPCPSGTDPRVWGNPHVETDEVGEGWQLVLSKEGWKLKLKDLEEQEQKRRKEHAKFMQQQKQKMSKAKSVAALLLEGCVIATDETRKWFY